MSPVVKADDYCVFSAMVCCDGNGFERLDRRRPGDFGLDPVHPCRWQIGLWTAFSPRHGGIVIDGLVFGGFFAEGRRTGIGGSSAIWANAIWANRGNHHGAVWTASRLIGLGTEAEVDQDRRLARAWWPCRPQRAAVLLLWPADPCRRPPLGRTWRPESLALCLRRARRPYMVMGGPSGRTAASGR